MNKTKISLLVLTGILPTQAATTFGSIANAQTGHAVPGFFIVESSPAPVVAPEDGGEGISFASNTPLPTPEGQATSSADLTVVTSSMIGPSIELPQLRTFASTNNGDFYANGSAYAARGYRYDGLMPHNASMPINLTGTVAGIDGGGEGNYATVSVWRKSDYEAGIPGGINPFRDSLLLQQFGVTPLATDTLFQSTSTYDSGVLNWMMLPGETVYITANATSVVYGPNSVADASSTLNLSFFDSNGLTALPVPEPSLPLLATLGTLTGIFRRSRHTR